MILPDVGSDFRVHASVKTGSDLPRGPSLVYYSRVETFLGFCTGTFRFLTKEGLDVILPTIPPQRVWSMSNWRTWSATPSATAPAAWSHGR